MEMFSLLSEMMTTWWNERRMDCCRIVGCRCCKAVESAIRTLICKRELWTAANCFTASVD